MNTDINIIEKGIKVKLARSLKEGTGKGPLSINVKVDKRYILIEIIGFLLPYEIQMAETAQGAMDVKINRLKWALTNKKNFIEIIKSVICIEVIDFFYDVNASTNTGMMVFIYK